MKRRILTVFLALLLCGSLVVCASAAAPFLVDEADILTNSEEAALNETLEEVSRTYNAQVCVVTLPAIDGSDVYTYIDTVYDSMGIGYGANRDGVLLLVCMEDREYCILSNGFAGVAIDPGTGDKIGEAFADDLSAGFYGDAFETYAQECAYYLDGHINGFPFHFGKKLITSAIFGILIGLIVAFILKGQLKSVRKQEQANSYVKSGSMHVTVQNDLFLYRNVTRTQKESKSSSSSGTARSKSGGSF